MHLARSCIRASPMQIKGAPVLCGVLVGDELLPARAGSGVSATTEYSGGGESECAASDARDAASLQAAYDAAHADTAADGEGAFSDAVCTEALMRDLTAHLLPACRGSGMLSDIPPPFASFVTAWECDPGTGGGAYAAVHYKAPGDVFNELAAPLRALHFAGEATHEEHLGSLQGALLSGQRAGAEVVAALRA